MNLSHLIQSLLWSCSLVHSLSSDQASDGEEVTSMSATSVAGDSSAIGEDVCDGAASFSMFSSLRYSRAVSKLDHPLPVGPLCPGGASHCHGVPQGGGTGKGGGQRRN